MDVFNSFALDRLTEVTEQVFGEWYPHSDRTSGIRLRQPRAAQLAAAEVANLESQYGKLSRDVHDFEVARLTLEYATLLNERVLAAA